MNYERWDMAHTTPFLRMTFWDDEHGCTSVVVVRTTGTTGGSAYANARPSRRSCASLRPQHTVHPERKKAAPQRGAAFLDRAVASLNLLTT